MSNILNRLFIIIFAILFYSCHNNANGVVQKDSNEQEYQPHDQSCIFIHDTIHTVIHDTLKQEIVKTVIIEKPIKIYQVVPELQIMDSTQMSLEFDNIIACGHIFCVPDKNGLMPSLFPEKHMKHFPMLYHIFTNNQVLPSGNYQYLEDFTSYCSSAIQDNKLFNAGKDIISKIKETIPHEYRQCGTRYPETYIANKFYKPEYYNLHGNDINIDSLRVRAIVHNDREALAKLEDYCQKINDPKGIAIYYKVMLGYEGNGDLAEKFYRVLEPYFKETPQFRMAVREALLRAALCDHNIRAQQLCDSLGFSLCDYRLPPIE